MDIIHCKLRSYCHCKTNQMILLILVLVLYLVISLCFLFLVNSSSDDNKQKVAPAPPGPRGLPFIGNLHQFDKTNPHLYLSKLSNKYGPLFSLKLGSIPTLVVSSSTMAKHFLLNHDSTFCSRPPVLGQQKLSYHGLDIAFTPHNHHWKEIRKLCSLHLFSSKKVMSFRSVREDEVSRVINKITSLASANKAANLSKITMSFASNLICRIGFGKRYEDEEYEKRRLDRLLIEAQSLMVGFYFSDHFPALGWLDGLSGILARLDKNFQELDVLYQQLISDHLCNEENQENKDILGLLLQMKQQEQSSAMKLTWDKIKAVLMNLFVAGTDTVAAGILWAMTALMMRPDIMEKAQRDIRELIGNKKTGGSVVAVDEDDVKKLPYLKAVIMETLRLYPPAPLLFRKADNGCHKHIIEIDGYKILPGTSVIINAWAIARDPQNWENPEAFMPQRFLDNDNNIITKGGYSLDFEMLPFGGGRRGCPGANMGMVAVELLLANLLYSFNWELPFGRQTKDIDTTVLPGLTMHKKLPLYLVPKVPSMSST